VSRGEGHSQSSIRCPMTTLDALVAGGTLPPPDVIKIDVEGGEWDVFLGARQTLAAHRPAIIFESDANAKRFGYTRRQLCDLLHSTAGYRFYIASPDRLEPAEARMDEEIDCNMLAISPEQKVEGWG
jgi:hypothetical protein